MRHAIGLFVTSLLMCACTKASETPTRQHPNERTDKSPRSPKPATTPPREGPIPVPERTDPPQQDGAPRATQIDVGASHACARMSDDTARCWAFGGDMTYGALGNGSLESTDDVVVVEREPGIVEVAVAQASTCVRLRDRTVECVGDNTYGQLGTGRAAGNRQRFEKVQDLVGAVEIDLTDGHACAVLEDGTVRCWGRNDYKQLGDGTTEEPPGLHRPSGLDGVIELDTADAACARRVNGTLWCWGTNHPELPRPYHLANAQTIDMGAFGGCALTAKKQAACWGFNDSGQLGIQPFSDLRDPPRGEDLDSRFEPGTVPGLDDVVDVAAAADFVCAVTGEGRVHCWGAAWGRPAADDDGCAFVTRHESRGGAAAQWRFCPEPRPIDGLAQVVQVDAAGRFACALSRDGAVHCWSPLRRIALKVPA